MKLKSLLFLLIVACCSLSYGQTKYSIAADTTIIGRPSGSPYSTLRLSSYKAPGGQRIYLYADEKGYVQKDTATSLGGGGGIDTAYFEFEGYEAIIVSGADTFRVPVDFIGRNNHFMSVGDAFDGDTSSSFVSVSNDGYYWLNGIGMYLVQAGVFNPDGSLNYMGIDTIRFTMNHQNPDGTEQYLYGSDGGVLIGSKTDDTTRNTLTSTLGYIRMESFHGTAGETWFDHAVINMDTLNKKIQVYSEMGDTNCYFVLDRNSFYIQSLKDGVGSSLIVRQDTTEITSSEIWLPNIPTGSGGDFIGIDANDVLYRGTGEAGNPLHLGNYYHGVGIDGTDAPLFGVQADSANYLFAFEESDTGFVWSGIMTVRDTTYGGIGWGTDNDTAVDYTTLVGYASLDSARYDTTVIFNRVRYGMTYYGRNGIFQFALPYYGLVTDTGYIWAVHDLIIGAGADYDDTTEGGHLGLYSDSIFLYGLNYANGTYYDISYDASLPEGAWGAGLLVTPGIERGFDSTVISSAQILDLHNTAIELLPAPTAGRYYRIEEVWVEYDYGTTAYSQTSGSVNFLFPSSTGAPFSLASSFVNETADAVYDAYAVPATASGKRFTAEAFQIEAANPITLGDGTWEVFVKYSIHSF